MSRNQAFAGNLFGAWSPIRTEYSACCSGSCPGLFRNEFIHVEIQVPETTLRGRNNLGYVPFKLRFQGRRSLSLDCLTALSTAAFFYVSWNASIANLIGKERLKLQIRRQALPEPGLSVERRGFGRGCAELIHEEA